MVPSLKRFNNFLIFSSWSIWSFSNCSKFFKLSISLFKSSIFLSVYFFSSSNSLICFLSLLCFGILTRKCDFPLIVDTAWELRKISTNSGFTLIPRFWLAINSCFLFSTFKWINSWNYLLIRVFIKLHYHSL